MAEIVRRLVDGAGLANAIGVAVDVARREPGSSETVELVERALALARRSGRGTPEDVESLGGGWTADEALAISCFCALKATSFEDGVCMAVNHSGDSDSTGSITGNLLGLIYGRESIPRSWLEVLELREVIEEIAADLWRHFAAEPPASCEGDGCASGNDIRGRKLRRSGGS